MRYLILRECQEEEQRSRGGKYLWTSLLLHQKQYLCFLKVLFHLKLDYNEPLKLLPGNNKCSSRGEQKTNSKPITIEYYSAIKKKQTTETFSNMDKSQKHHVRSLTHTHCVWFHLNNTLEKLDKSDQWLPGFRWGGRWNNRTSWR